MPSLADHIVAGAQVGDTFLITGFDLKASDHTLGLPCRPDTWTMGTLVTLLEWQAGDFIQRCRFSIKGAVWSGKAHALRLQCVPVRGIDNAI